MATNDNQDDPNDLGLRNLDTLSSTNSLDIKQEEDLPDYNDITSTPTAQDTVSPVERKWLRLRKNYNDQYLDLFNRTFSASEDDYFKDAELPATQLGVVLWTSSEKDKLFETICRKGQHDLPALANAVGSKSVVEVQAYLDNLHEQDADHRRFEAASNNISQADIPAAIEIGPECEAVLDRAADALLAFQEQYDSVAGRQGNDHLWIIDRQVAEELDAKFDDAAATKEADDEDLENSSDEHNDLASTDRAFPLFHLTTFLTLSERFFMPNHHLLDPEDRPSLTTDTLLTFHSLLTSLLHRLIQSTLFIALSRLRASTTRDYRPSKMVKIDDVHAALEVLGMKRNAEEFWVGVARRNGLKVVDERHRRGWGAGRVVGYEEVEEILGAGRRRRDVSAGEVMEGVVDGEGDGSPEGGQDDQDEEDETGDEIHAPSASEEPSPSSSSPSTSSSASPSPLPDPTSLEDKYLKILDHQSRLREESRLLSMLRGSESFTDGVKEGELKMLGASVREMKRKAEEERLGSEIVATGMGMGMGLGKRGYEAEWEGRSKRRRGQGNGVDG